MLFFKYLPVSLLLLGPLLAAAQTPPAAPLPQLLAERKALTDQYAAANAQRHSLFGLSNKPSKKDLQEVVDALQGIVNKDEQIVAVLNQTAQTAQETAQTAQATASQLQTTTATLQTTTATLQNTSRDDRNLSAQRFNELQNDLNNAQVRQKQAATREQALTADLAEAQHSQHLRDALVAGLALVCVGLFFWRRR
ncbi:MAG: hypothetical protein ACRYFX_03670 [Janthinobacterium lividum]